MWRKTTVKLSKTFRIDYIVFPLILISIAALFPNDVQAACDPEFNCGSCTDDGRCITCRTNHGYQNLTGHCEHCGTNCLECSPFGGNCTRCILGYGPDFKSGHSDCSPCIQDNCDGGCTVYGAGTCDKCNDGYGPIPATTNCTNCTEHCQSCPVKTSECETCEFGYAAFVPGNKSCGACSLHCTISGCFGKGPGACKKCDPGYEFFRNNFSCGACAANCASCPVNGASQCDNCTFGYGLTPTNTCALCSTNCKEHGCNITGAGKCDMCDFGYGLLLNGSCDRCSDNCTIYGCNTTGAHNCTKCDPGFGIFPNGSCGACAANCTSCPVNGAGRCDNCTFGYGLTPTNTCAPCSNYCKMYGCSKEGAFECDICDTGHVYFKNNKTCGNCAANCTSCPINGADHCDNCTFGYGLTPTNTCEPCSDYCEMHGCSKAGAGQCDDCDTGYVFYKTNRTCGNCSANCTSCPVNGAGLCDNCTLGYGLTPTNTCAPCAPNCATYGCEKNGAGKCDQCDPGFLLIVSSGTCALVTTTALPTTTSIPTTTRGGTDDGGGTNKYTTSASNNGSGDGHGGGGDDGGGNGSDTTTPSSIDVNGKATTNLDLNLYYSVSGLHQDTTPSSDGEIDWRILLTFLMLILGGIFVTFVATLCWATRFGSTDNIADNIAGLRRQRRRISRLKES